MIVSFSNDQERGAGYGILLVAELGPVADPQSLQFSLRRASDQQCLSTGGWQPAEVFVSPEQVDAQAGNTRIMLGPQVIDQLDPQETYRFTLRGSDIETTRATLTVQGVVYSPASGGQGLAAPVAASAVPAPPVVEELPPPVVEELPPPPVEVPVIPDLVAGGAINAPSTSAGIPKGVLIGVLVLLLAGGGAGAWFFTKGGSSPGAVNGTSTAPLTFKQQAHEHLKGTADPIRSLELAREFIAKPDGIDSAFLLLEDAAEKGNVEAMLLTAEFYDPVSVKPGGSIQKSPMMAYTWYKKAQQAGNAEAEARLQALRTWAEADGNKNSDEAKELLKQPK